jgi:hypothetical protein
MIKKELDPIRPRPDLLIHGGARGADTLADSVAVELGIPVRVFPAHWNQFGRGAGPVRNKEMLMFLMHPSNRDHHKLVMAFHDDLTQSKGTAHMVKISREVQLDVRVFGHPGANDSDFLHGEEE